MLGAVARTYARPIEIVMRATFYFDFHVSDAYVFGQSTSVKISTSPPLLDDRVHVRAL